MGKNKKSYDVVVGMYHDQVLTPIKTIMGLKAINITLGLPFIRISPDHGVASDIMGKNIESLRFLGMPGPLSITEILQTVLY